LEDDWVPGEDGRSLDDIEEEARKREAGARAVVLEMIGDLPEADAKPPADMLFVCKLNPVTTEEARHSLTGTCCPRLARTPRGFADSQAR
jgi:peptidyl-prolyl cis-trans isomerase-like 4